MFAAFGDEFVKLVFSPDAADQRIQFKVRWKSLENPVPASDLSDGTLRFLYLLAILANPNPPPLIAIDEPETGLHPRMLSIIGEFAAEAARRTQVVFTTHSAAFLDGLNRFNPITTIVESLNSETQIKNVSTEVLGTLAERVHAWRIIPLSHTGDDGVRFVLLAEGQTEKEAIGKFLKRWLDAQLMPNHVGVRVVDLAWQRQFREGHREADANESLRAARRRDNRRDRVA